MENIHLNIALNEAGKLIKEKLKSSASADGFKASGELDKSFGYSAAANELSIFASKYAGALSGGISTGGGSDAEGFKKMQSNLIKWAKMKGIRPQIRDKKGRFAKINDKSWKSLGFVLARSIRQRGLSKRFGYKGSGFIQEVKNSMESKITDMIMEGYKKDLQEQLNKINK
tara:strand:- start:1670 stop:2182 length:513 start_codon:yes stop_codon:yes gene_type:complete